MPNSRGAEAADWKQEEKNKKNQRTKKFRKNICFRGRGFICSAGLVQLRSANLLFILTILFHVARHLLDPARHRRLGSTCTLSASPLLMDNCRWAKAAPEGGPWKEYRELCWALSTGCFLSRTAPVMLHNLLMEIHPESANSSTRHCNAWGRPTGDTLRVIMYSF